jgi:riboflavin synthase
MFTGLVEGVGEVLRVQPKGPDAVLIIKPPWPLAEAVLGESVAINGVCLTVTGTGGGGFSLDVSAESLSRTTLGKLKAGDKVNLERALKLGDRLGGHLVSGHVDCVGHITAKEKLGDSVRFTVSIPPEHLRFVVEKGSVALEGISLTVNQVDAAGFSLNIIPHTMAGTTLQLAAKGDSVNIETDMIGKYVARLLNRDEPPSGGPQGLTREHLAQLGF